MKRYKIPIKIYEIPGGGTHLLLKVKINNVSGFLLIDTGASNSVFDSDNSLFNDINFHEKDDEMQSSGFNSAIENLQTGKITSLNICHFKTELPEAIFTSLGHINQLYQSIKLPIIFGIIGSDFLLKFNANIDFKTKILYLEKI
jgi:hypothetical protein